MCRILQEKVCKTRTTDLDPLSMPLTNGCRIRHDPVLTIIQLVQISDARLVHILLQYFPHSVINWIQIW